MSSLKWWMRTVGAFYVLLALASFLRVPIRTEGPTGVMDQISAGTPIAKFLVDSWITYGVDFLIVGAALLIASRLTGQARVLVWMVLGLESFRGIGIDFYKLARGYNVTQELVWIAIHSAIIATGIASLRRNGLVEAANTHGGAP